MLTYNFLEKKVRIDFLLVIQGDYNKYQNNLNCYSKKNFLIKSNVL